MNEFCENFFSKQFNNKYPRWIYKALKKAGVNVSFMEDDLREDADNNTKPFDLNE